jgi:hypothetical protein
MQTSKFRTKLQNSISASKLIFENPSEEIRSQIMQQLSHANRVITIYHMDSLWRNNDDDKYDLPGHVISENTKYTNS